MLDLPPRVSETPPSTTVYSWYYPEVAACVNDFLSGIENRAEITQILRSNLNPGLDDFHLPLIEKWIRLTRGEGVIGLEEFEHQYYTNGSSEGIFHWLTQYATENAVAEGDEPPLYQFEGEYEGYSAYAKTLGIEITPVSSVEQTKLSGIFLISNPSSIDGNICTERIKTVLDAGHQVVVDLAYVGMTLKPLNLDLSHPGIISVFGSMSKPFGLYYYRIGFCFSRYEISSLVGNKWFKNVLSILVAEHVLDNLDIQQVKTKYGTTGYMRRIASGLVGVDLQKSDDKWFLEPSDVWILAYAKGKAKYGETPYSRTPTSLRVCLTPYFQHRDADLVIGHA